jgi:uncharacterized protein YwqG
MEGSLVMDLSTGVRAAVRERLEASRAAEYLALARPSVGFSIRSAGQWKKQGDERERGSAIGGEPRTVAFRWPTYDGEPMLLLAQIDCAEVSALLGTAWPFPTDGYLLFFHDEEFAAEPDLEHGDDGCRVLHVESGDGADEYELEDDEEDDEYEDDDEEDDEEDDEDEVDIVIIDALPLDPEPMMALPDFHDHSDAAGFDAAGDAFAAGVHEEVRTLLPIPRHRLLGWCDHETPRPEGLRPLLQVEAEEGTEWGEVVNVSFWISDDDLRAGRLDGVRRSYETA